MKPYACKDTYVMTVMIQCLESIGDRAKDELKVVKRRLELVDFDVMVREVSLSG